MKQIVAAVLVLASGTVHAAPQAASQALNDGILAYTPGDYETAVPDLMPFAEADNALAQLILGKTLIEPLNRHRDCQTSKYWLERSAAGGNAEASSLLGDIYDRGVCGKPDKLIALGWYLDAYEKGWSPAATHVGAIYLSASESSERMHQARHWFLEGVANFEWDAAFQLGRMYANGLGVQTDNLQALIWFQTAFLIAPEYDDERERSMRARDAARERLTLTAIAAGLNQAKAIVDAVMSHRRIPYSAGIPPAHERMAKLPNDVSAQKAISLDSE